ncbi:hypothetical protein PPERSA_04253 [Pseudocohnilembus persalinus]|uniref:LITAF domain-containing protein n=1 Tax=Pseudocohnilembus persalinus TaxID=266149 RepID=A0A0V0QNR7_PSEPJ|nr:hypothetical protein PPERSA_04253 [Pseudocohnilembus persalinus]|eukprot:KRX03745.1 hypothetical protein PPERSA_04253 [Pseudocohnilembus persalinus]
MTSRFKSKEQKDKFNELQEEELEILQKEQEQTNQQIKQKVNEPISLEDETADTIFGNEPIQTRCPYCGAQTLTEVKFQNGILTYILLFLSLMVFGLLLSLIIIPLVFVFTKSLVHSCGQCEQEIGTNQEIIFGSGIKDGIISLKVGEFGFIISRRIILTVICGILTVGIFYSKIANLNNGYGHSHLHDQLIYTNTTWNEFVSDCGLKSLTTHQKFHECEKKYIDQTITNWKGYIIRVEDYRQSLYKYLHHAVSILVKMEESEIQNLPDVLLTFDSEQVDIFEDLVNTIDRGDHIGFNATIKTIGTMTQTRHLHIVSIWKEEGHINIPAHIHGGGRYDDTPRRMRGKNNQQPPQIQSIETEENANEEEKQEKAKEKQEKAKEKQEKAKEKQSSDQKEQKSKTQTKKQTVNDHSDNLEKQKNDEAEDDENISTGDESQEKIDEKFQKDKKRYENVKEKKEQKKE